MRCWTGEDVLATLVDVECVCWQLPTSLQYSLETGNDCCKAEGVSSEVVFGLLHTLPASVDVERMKVCPSLQASMRLKNPHATGHAPHR